LIDADQEQKNHRADGCRDDRAEQAAAQRQADAGANRKPAIKRADDADDDVADQAEAVAIDDLPGKPARDGADDENDEKCGEFPMLSPFRPRNEGPTRNACVLTRGNPGVGSRRAVSSGRYAGVMPPVIWTLRCMARRFPTNRRTASA
jgi:hypothetical protein